MKSVMISELIPGMVLGEDILYNEEILYPKNTVLNEVVIKGLNRYSIEKAVIKEDIDLAATHYERVRFNDDFKLFAEKHKKNLFVYKRLMLNFIETKQLIPDSALLAIYNDMASTYSYGSELLDFLYNLIPNEDELTFNHCLNSALLSGTFADWNNMPRQDADQLILACFYYDIGKLKLPYEILWKAGKLTDEEFALVKKHPVIGYALLNQTNIDQRIKNAVIMHHERMNGSGYPYHMKGNGIDLYARYIAIIDTYIAMASPRSYRDALTPLQILGYFELNMQEYDTEILLPLMKRIGDAQIGSTVQLNDGSVWEVVIIHPAAKSRPILQNDNAQVLDLLEHPELQIVKSL